MKKTLRKYFKSVSLGVGYKIWTVDIILGIVLLPFWILFLPFTLLANWLNK